MYQLPFNSFYSFFFTFLIFILGLTSCAPDKQAPAGPPERQTVDDSFKLEPPIIRRADGSNDVPLTSAFSTPLSTEDKLVFPSVAQYKKENLKSTVKFIVHTTCRKGNVASEAIATIQNRSELVFRDLMPADVFFLGVQSILDPEASTAKAAAPCKFEVTALNPIGSEIHYRIQTELMISRGTLGLPMSSRQADLDIHPVTGLIPDLLTNDAAQVLFRGQTPSVGEARLICEGFENQVQFGPQSPLNFSRIVSAPSSESGLRSFLPLSAKPRQLCRLIVASAAEDRNLLVSSYFYLQGEASPLEIYTQFEINGYDEPRPNRIRVLGIAIRNDNDVAVPFSISLPTEKTLILQPILQSTNSAFLGWRSEAPIELSFDHGKKSASASGKISYLIPPHEEVVINGHANINTVCFGTTQEARRRPFDGYVGYYYAFDTRAIRLQQSADNKINNDGTINIAFERQLFRDLPDSAYRPLPGWAPWTKHGGWGYKPFRELQEVLKFTDIPALPYNPQARPNAEYGCQTRL